MSLSEIVQLLVRCELDFRCTGSTSFLNFSIGYLSSAEKDGCYATYNDLISAYDDYIDYTKHREASVL